MENMSIITENPADYGSYYLDCMKRITDPPARDYLKKIGISPEMATQKYIGFDPEADPENAPGGMGEKLHPAPRLIIPSSPGNYIGYGIDEKGQVDIKILKNHPAEIYNKYALYEREVQEVFIVNGTINALSVIEAGGVAIGLNGANNATDLINTLAEKRTTANIILSLDNNPEAERIAESLQRLNISFISADITAGHKNPNEALTTDRGAFIEAVEQARQRITKPDNTAYYIDALMSGEIAKFKQEVKTGFTNLDSRAGGLYAGLYVLAAISSLGKTTFALQLADQIAEGGNDVLFFSLEQSRLELVSKSIARITAQRDIKKAVTSLQIRKGTKTDSTRAAVTEYKEAIADRISIIEGNFSCNTSFIGDYVRNYIKRNGTRPVVFIDYLQILQPAEDKRQTTKEVIDTTITTLKRLSRELDIVIIAISSINRGNYLTPIDFESLKESGSIEYSADVIWGLQLQCINDVLFNSDKNTKKKREEVNKAKAADPRKIELVCLKNRYGKSNFNLFYKYYPKNDLFVEDMGGEWEPAEKIPEAIRI